MDGKYILTYIDYYSSEAHVLKKITSSEVIRVLTDILSRFVFPEEVASDNGKQFISAEFEAFLKTCGIRHIRASPCYARGSGKVERFHRYLKNKFSRRDRRGQVLAERFTEHSHVLSGNSSSD